MTDLELELMVSNETIREAEESFEYAKYWHGYLIFLRPLLLILNYMEIRLNHHHLYTNYCLHIDLALHHKLHGMGKASHQM